MGNIEIKYAEVERPIVGIELSNEVGEKVKLLFRTGDSIPKCKKEYERCQKEPIFHFYVDNRCSISGAGLTVEQMEALEKAIHSMVASIKEE